MILIHPAYFPNIAHMAAVVQADGVVFEIEDNYQKQTYRNRAYIAHANGRLSLNIPIKHSHNGARQATKTVEIDNSFPWQSQHWKSLQTAYRTSPFFEYYEDEIHPLFDEPANELLAFNLKIYETLCELIGIDSNFELSKEYFKNPDQKDLRQFINAKKEPLYNFQPYSQVLQEHHGFLPNLSVLDLLFNEGPNTLSYLENQKLD